MRKGRVEVVGLEREKARKEGVRRRDDMVLMVDVVMDKGVERWVSSCFWWRARRD